MQCHFCSVSEPPPKYTCPQCQAPYCSLPCYQSRKHVQCSENFYKECVSEELRMQGGADKDAKARMIETLQRVHASEQEEGEDLDSDDEDDLTERMKGVDLDDADDVWNALTVEEKKDFERLLDQGDVEKVMPRFEPFWEHYEERKLVAEVVGEKEKKENAFKAKCPILENNIPDFATLFKGEPSASVKFGLINVIYSYCYTARFFFGDVTTQAVSAADMMLALSSSLRGAAGPFESADMALEAAAAEAKLRPDLSLPPNSVKEVKKDAWKVVRGPGGDAAANKDYYILSALSDAKRLLERALKAAKKNNKDFDRGQAKKAVKKVEFYLSWTKKYSTEFDLIR